MAIRDDPDRNLLLTLQKVTKLELVTIAKKESRSVNNLINVAIENFIERYNKKT